MSFHATFLGLILIQVCYVLAIQIECKGAICQKAFWILSFWIYRYPGVGIFASLNEAIYSAQLMHQWQQPGQFNQVLDTSTYLEKL